MKIVFTEHSWSDYLYWHKNDKRMLRRINELIRDAMRSPFCGVGKPEPLKHQLHGCWSRRINEEHRVIYEVPGEEVRIVSCRYHY